jgi:hypothetical protein
MVVAGVVLVPWLLASPITTLVSPARADQERTYRQHYVWKDAPLPGPLNSVIHAVFWHDEREPGHSYGAITELLWSQSRSFDSFDAIVAAVERHSSEDGTIFGDSGSVPLVALGAHRRITADFADTNTQRFRSGQTLPADAIAALEAEGGPTLMLNANNTGVFKLPEFQQYLSAHYHVVEQFADTNGTTYALYARDGTTSPQ